MLVDKQKLHSTNTQPFSNLFFLSRIPSCEEFICLFATATSAAFLYFLGHSAQPLRAPPHPRSAAARLHILCSGVCILCSGVCKPMSRHANLYSDHRAAARYGLHVKCALGLSEQRPLPTFACLMSERSDVDVSPTYTSTTPPPGPSTLFTKVLAENLLC